MKKIILLLCFLSFLFSGNIHANDPDLFKFDEVSLEAGFAKLNELENFVNLNPGITLTEIIQSNNKFINQLKINNLSNPFPLGTPFTIDDMDWNAFAWGFCCWPVGFFTVAINDEKESNQKFSFWIGLATNVIFDAISADAYYKLF